MVEDVLPTCSLLAVTPDMDAAQTEKVQQTGQEVQAVQASEGNFLRIINTSQKCIYFFTIGKAHCLKNYSL